jgi:aldehyde dehydrogenase (NAD+)
MTVRSNLIGGEWLCGEAERPNINPSDTDDVIGIYAQADADQVAAAVAAARAALPVWSGMTGQARADILQEISAEIFARRQELADLLAREEGKTLREALGEVDRAGHIFRYFAGESVRRRGDWIPSVRDGVEVATMREPVGVVALITPWNFPIAIPAWKIAPALAFGNCVLLKPADLTPGCAWELADIIHRAGVPAGAFNLLMGRGSMIGPVLTGPGVDAISFTGSTGVGQSILNSAARHRAKVQLEMGGKNPILVLKDADLDKAVACALDGAFFSTGQRCTASSRIIVEQDIHDRFVDKLREAMRAQVVGDARASGTTIGPVVDEAQLATDLEYIAIAQDEGARLAEGGERLVRETEGFYLSPALFVDTRPEMRINQEEVFGPVASVIRVRDYEEGLQVANDVPFGLAASICTSSLRHASHFRQNAKVGMVMVNLPSAGVDYHVPFGGTKASSYGPREQGTHAAEFFSTVKTAYINAG